VSVDQVSTYSIVGYKQVLYNVLNGQFYSKYIHI